MNGVKLSAPLIEFQDEVGLILRQTVDHDAPVRALHHACGLCGVGPQAGRYTVALPHRAIEFQQVIRGRKPEAPLAVFHRRMHRQVEPGEAFRRLPERRRVARQSLGAGQPERLAILGVDIEHVAGEHPIAQHRRPSAFRQAKERSTFQNPHGSIRPAPPAGSAVGGNVDLLQALGGPPYHRHSPRAGLCLREQFAIAPSHGITKVAQPGARAGYLVPLRNAVPLNPQSGQTPLPGDPEIRGPRRHRRKAPQAGIVLVPELPPRLAGRIVFAQRGGEQHDHTAPRRHSRDQAQAGRRPVLQLPPAGPVFHQVSIDGRPGGPIGCQRCPSASELIRPDLQMWIGYVGHRIAIQDAHEWNRAVADRYRTAWAQSQRVAEGLLQPVGECPESPDVAILRDHGRSKQKQRDSCDPFLHHELRIPRSPVISAETLPADRPEDQKTGTGSSPAGFAGIWAAGAAPGSGAA